VTKRLRDEATLFERWCRWHPAQAAAQDRMTAQLRRCGRGDLDRQSAARWDGQATRSRGQRKRSRSLLRQHRERRGEVDCRDQALVSPRAHSADSSLCPIRRTVGLRFEACFVVQTVAPARSTTALRALGQASDDRPISLRKYRVPGRMAARKRPIYAAIDCSARNHVALLTPEASLRVPSRSTKTIFSSSTSSATSFTRATLCYQPRNARAAAGFGVHFVKAPYRRTNHVPCPPPCRDSSR
jgi:hypothetical protein